MSGVDAPRLGNDGPATDYLLTVVKNRNHFNSILFS